MRATECCGWTGWAEMAGIGVDGRRLAGVEPENPAARACTSTHETRDAAALGALYLLMGRLRRRAVKPTRSASAERAVGAP